MRQIRPVSPTPSQPELSPHISRVTAVRQCLGQQYTRFRILLLIVLCAVISLATILAYNKTQPPPQRLSQRDIDIAVGRSLETTPPKPSFQSQVYAAIRPSLVEIHARIPGAAGKSGDALGTGVIVNDSGLILTSLHIIKGASEVSVTFSDGSHSAADIVVQQPENDLAVLQPQEIPDDLVPATLGGSGNLRVGDDVVAVGNPFGITGSLSAGVISGLHRNFKSPKTGDTLNDLIQFDAAVNPGNSGGPLLNRSGEVIGIVTALLNPTDQDVFIGIGFAVPIETAGGAAGAPPV